VKGTEAILSPFSFELQLISGLSDIDSAAIIDQPATICLRCVPGNGGEMRVWKGIVSEFEQLGSLGAGRYRYCAVMVALPPTCLIKVLTEMKRSPGPGTQQSKAWT